ncbi:uncharacterized protein LOC129927410 [Biomphalaria glabrata]|uniref:Uncharacterized protein LOC129927410 n=1 Tax=Biomphalaria glabrata TaxID=6526 RepID=A0A9W3AYU5_BIOGL|nr:uncharacterized protein LOC129927410 [Biomphalaria glabrata]
MLALYALLLCLPAVILGQDLHALANQNFDQIDIDKDGFVLLYEFEQFFMRMDTNHDSRVSRHEYTVQVTNIYGHDPQLNHVMHALYDELDINSDHHVDTVDIDTIFDIADKDNDDRVNREEFAEYFVRAIQIATGK